MVIGYSLVKFMTYKEIMRLKITCLIFNNLLDRLVPMWSVYFCHTSVRRLVLTVVKAGRASSAVW